MLNDAKHLSHRIACLQLIIKKIERIKLSMDRIIEVNNYKISITNKQFGILY